MPLLSVTSTGSQWVAVGGGGTILTAPDEANIGIISPGFRRAGISLRRTSSRLIAALPTSGGRSLRAGVYSTAGDRMREGDAAGANGEIAVPLDGMAQGNYWLEITGSGGKWIEAFSILP